MSYQPLPQEIEWCSNTSDEEVLAAVQRAIHQQHLAELSELAGTSVSVAAERAAQHHSSPPA